MRFTAQILLAAAVSLLIAPSRTQAIEVVLDYTYDSSAFFNPATTSGQQARAAVQAAADFYTEILEDTFSAIETPDPYVGQVSTQTWTWDLTFSNPSGSGQVTLTDQSIAADEYRVYVGAQPISGSAIAFGGPGGWSFSGSTDGPGYFPDELAEVQQIGAAFSDAVQNRGEPNGFANWGGAITFDTGTSWHFDHTASPTPGTSDVFSVALHELVHAFGFGTSDEWNALLSGTSFLGPASVNAYSGLPPVDEDGGHWEDGIQSTVFGGTSSQEVLMDSATQSGTRMQLTLLDAAALTDIGWTVVEPEPSSLPGDYNDDGLVDAADYTIWRDNLGGPTPMGTYLEWSANYGSSAPTSSIPEPSATLLAAVALSIGCLARVR